MLSRLVVSDFLQPHGLHSTRILCPESLQARILEQVAISSSRDLPDTGIEPTSPVSLYWQVDSLPLSYLGSPYMRGNQKSKHPSKILKPIFELSHSLIAGVWLKIVSPCICLLDENLIFSGRSEYHLSLKLTLQLFMYNV